MNRLTQLEKTMDAIDAQLANAEALDARTVGPVERERRLTRARYIHEGAYAVLGALAYDQQKEAHGKTVGLLDAQGRVICERLS